MLQDGEAQLLQGLVTKAQEQTVLEDAAAQGGRRQARFLADSQAGTGDHSRQVPMEDIGQLARIPSSQAFFQKTLDQGPGRQEQALFIVERCHGLHGRLRVFFFPGLRRKLQGHRRLTFKGRSPANAEDGADAIEEAAGTGRQDAVDLLVSQEKLGLLFYSAAEL